MHFAGQYEEVQAPLLAVMRDLGGSLGQGAAMCAAMLAGAMVACLSISQVRPFSFCPACPTADDGYSLLPGNVMHLAAEAETRLCLYGSYI